MTREMGTERISRKRERITSIGRFNSGSLIMPIGIAGCLVATGSNLMDKLLDLSRMALV
jgi:hypothetical protein